MSARQESETAMARIAIAFSPLKIDAAVSDHGNRVRVVVFSPSGERIFEPIDILRSQLVDVRRLDSILIQCRSQLIERGYELLPYPRSA